MHKMTQASCGVRPMRISDLKTVLAWRNHPDISRYMYTQHEIKADEHKRWFLGSSKDTQRHLLIFEDGPDALGFINIHQIGPGGIAEWGFYTAPHAPKGTGRALGNAALRYAFAGVGLHKLCGQVVASNERSIQFHGMLGFMKEGFLRQHYFDGQHYHDVVCFGLLAREWQPQD